MRSARNDHGRHAVRMSDAVELDRCPASLDRIVDHETGADLPTSTVDQDTDRLLRALLIQDQDLTDKLPRTARIDLSLQKDQPI